MDALVVDLLLLIVAAAFAPVYLLAVLMLLINRRGLRGPIAFVSVVIAVRLIQGAVFGFVLAPAVDAETNAGLKVIGPTLLVVVGILMLVTGVRSWRRAGNEAEEAEQVRWMRGLARLSPVRLAGVGALLVLLAARQWVFTLAAISLIEEVRPGLWAGVAAYLLFTVGTQILVIGMIVASAAAPETIASPLRTVDGWLRRHGQVAFLIVSVVFGGSLLMRGIADLVASSRM